MKRMIAVVLAMGLLFDVTTICFGMDSMHPDFGKESNIKKGEKMMGMLDKAERKLLRAFPQYEPNGEWTVSYAGYQRWYAYGKRSVQITLSYDGGIYFMTDVGDMVALK